MRRKRRRRARAAVRKTRMVVLIAITVGAFAALPPSTWHSVEHMVRGHLDTLEEVVGPAAERTAVWFADGAGAVRDALGEGSAGATLSGSARVIDGDTLEVRGTRIRLHGIDAPEAGAGPAGGRRPARSHGALEGGRSRARSAIGTATVASSRCAGSEAPSSAVRSGSSLPFRKRRISAGCASNRSARALGV